MKLFMSCFKRLLPMRYILNGHLNSDILRVKNNLGFLHFSLDKLLEPLYNVVAIGNEEGRGSKCLSLKTCTSVILNIPSGGRNADGIISRSLFVRVGRYGKRL